MEFTMWWIDVELQGESHLASRCAEIDACVCHFAVCRGKTEEQSNKWKGPPRSEIMRLLSLAHTSARFPNGY
eukprot:12170018-Alexandrium_andersonii.AAC.1